ncbi:MAG: hypothetical protein HKN06_03575 [Gammaproteobacteria bacterium]|nr:hypothetical protein [Gammaproteobacteria bacterium]
MSRLFDALHNAGNDVARKLDPREATQSSPREALQPPRAAQPGDERFFALLEALRNIHSRRHGRIVALMGVRGGEGTSVLTRDLAGFIARQTGAQVLLLDAKSHSSGGLQNLRRPGALDSVVTLRSPGLVHPPRTGLPSNCTSATLLAESDAYSPEDTARFFGQVAAEFEWVVLDCPPVLHPEYQNSSARVADGIILLAESDRTETNDLIRASRTLKIADANVLGVVLNKRTNFVPSVLRRVLSRLGISL